MMEGCGEWMMDEEMSNVDLRDQVIGEYQRFAMQSVSSDERESDGTDESDGSEGEEEDYW
jgi:hypothetical protein